jgi:glucose/mannose transport system permease protein
MAEALSQSGKARLGRLVVYGCLIVVALVYLMPLWVMVVTSLKPLD